ncbi:MAG: hypothetical protein IKC83_00280 [Clostridia bacterium]|nr:hypothetical protein [Clostridia bacterium]
MKCFIHSGEEAVASCKKCGKGMCANCSAYSNHTGICPECRKDEFINEKNVLEDENKIIPWRIAGWVLFSCTVIGAIIGIPKIIARTIDLNNNKKRIDYLSGEINKLNQILVYTGKAVI